jgi:hypothetical protein
MHWKPNLSRRIIRYVTFIAILSILIVCRISALGQ